jgi:hypothetical protein
MNTVCGVTRLMVIGGIDHMPNPQLIVVRD